MSDSNLPDGFSNDLRAVLTEAPHLILDDPAIMRAIVDAHDAQRGENVFDLRAVAMERLTQRLNDLKDTHQNVIAAAYDNIAGTNQIHRAVLRVLAANDLQGLIALFNDDLPQTLHIECIRLIVEKPLTSTLPTNDLFQTADAGFVERYMSQKRPVMGKKVVLHSQIKMAADVYGPATPSVKSEACLKIDLGNGAVAVLLLGGNQPTQFEETQGTDLLEFFAQVCGSVLQKWLTS